MDKDKFNEFSGEYPESVADFLNEGDICELEQEIRRDGPGCRRGFREGYRVACQGGDRLWICAHSLSAARKIIDDHNKSHRHGAGILGRCNMGPC